MISLLRRLILVVSLVAVPVILLGVILNRDKSNIVVQLIGAIVALLGVNCAVWLVERLFRHVARSG
jgi:hypothetical protein